MYMTVEETFSSEGFNNHFDSLASKGEHLLVHFKIVGAGDWTLTIKDGTFTLEKGEPSTSPQIVFSFLAEDYLRVVNGQISLQSAYMSGLVGVSGDLPAALKFPKFFPANKEG